MHKALFQMYNNFKNERLSVDLSNSLPFDLDGKLRNLGNLMLGIKILKQATALNY